MKCSAGSVPFQGEYEQAVIYSIINEEPQSLKKLCPEVSSGLEQIVLQALAKKPDDRYQTMEEFREDLAAVAEGLKPLKAKVRTGRAREVDRRAALHQRQPRPGERLFHQRSDGRDTEQPAEDQSDLRVISRTSVEQYRERKKPVREIAAELGCELHRGGQRVRNMATPFAFEDTADHDRA
jgi:serine/threonine protein kinase